MADQGWIKLHRCIRSNWVWNDKPFSRGQAFLDLLLIVNHEDKKIIFNGSLTEVKRGSGITSIRKLQEKWGWSNRKVKMFLEQLKLDQTIDYKCTTKNTVITIVNYDFYQGRETEKHHQSINNAPQMHIKSISEAYQKHTNKNDKEYIKNDKERKEGKEEVPRIPPLSFPTPTHEMLFKEFGEVGYKTWFIDSKIESEDGLIKITANDSFKKGIIQDKYSEKIRLLTGKKILLEEVQ